MIIKDMMPAFELYQPTQVADALTLLNRFGKDGWKLAGGNDSLSWFKERAKRPKAVIDITGIAELKGIKETPDGIEIGALTTLTEIERNPIVRAQYRVLSDAARRVVVPVRVQHSGPKVSDERSVLNVVVCLPEKRDPDGVAAHDRVQERLRL